MSHQSLIRVDTSLYFYAATLHIMQIIIPAASGTYGGGMYGGGALPSSPCSDTITGLSIPYSIVAQFPVTVNVINPATVFGLSTTTTLSEGTNATKMQLPAVTLYSVFVSTNLSSVVDSDVFSLTRGSTLSAASQTLVADVSSSAILTLLAAFLIKLAPVFCVPGPYSGTALPATAGLMDIQVSAVAQSLLDASQLYSSGGVLKALAPVNASSPSVVQSLLQAGWGK